MARKKKVSKKTTRKQPIRSVNEIPNVEGPDPKTASLEELETPDQLEERNTAPAVKKKVRVATSGNKKAKTLDEEVDPERKDVPIEEMYQQNRAKLTEKHPNWKPNPEWQILMFTDMMKINEAETKALHERMNELEILLEMYPLIATNQDLDELRHAMRRNLELEAERNVLIQAVTMRQRYLNPPEETPEPEKKGFFKRLFNK